MNGEYLSLETAKKLRSREKAIKYIKDMLFIVYNEEESYINLTYVEEILRILEG